MSSSLDLLVAATSPIEATMDISLSAGDYGWDSDAHLSVAHLTQDVATSAMSATPTDAEIDTATGLTPSTAGGGWSTIIRDTGTKTWRIVSDGTDWFFSEMTKAT